MPPNLPPPATLPPTGAPAREDDPTPARAPAPDAVPDGEVVLSVRDLRTYFFTFDGVVRALDGVTFELRRGETTGLLGETGCGKSVTARSILRLVPDPPGRVIGGSISYRGVDLLWGLEREARYDGDLRTDRVKVRRSSRGIKAAHERMSAIRGRRITMIFQEPSEAFRPELTVATQLGSALLLSRGLEILDGLLGATPDDPAVPAALEAVVAATARPPPRPLRAAANALGEAARSPDLATEAFHLALESGSPSATSSDLARAVRRRRLTRVQRRYLAHRRRLYALDESLRSLYLAEMRTRTSRRGARRANRVRAAAERLSHAYFGLWGLREHVAGPLYDELFWRVVRLLEGVSVANPVEVARGFPHQLSGGALKRVMVAEAISPDPDVLIADEPTGSLDVAIQARVLERMRELRERLGSAVLLISHDLGVIAEAADRVYVMYAGEIVEGGTVRDVFHHPLHPYTQGLLASVPRFDRPGSELRSIPGSLPDPLDHPPGCRFHPRCPSVMPICREERPPTTQEGSGRTVACYLYSGPRVVR